MAFTIPNLADAFHADQAQVDRVDFDILQAGYGFTSVVSGCDVTAQGTPNMTCAVAAGEVLVNGISATVTTGNVTITAAHATNPRFDLVVASSTGVKSVTAGTAAANPVFPVIPASSVVLATVYVPANVASIATNKITDKRVITGAAGYRTVQDEGGSLTQRSTLDFTGAGVTASDTGSKTLVTIAGTTGLAGYDTVKDEGSALVQRTVLNFTGAGVTASDVAGETQVNIPVGTTYETSSQTASYTVVLADATKVIEVNSVSAVTVTLPTNATAAFPTGSWMEVFQQGTGQVTIAGATGVTLRSRGGLLATAGQYAELRLRKRDINTWVVSGDLA